MEILDRWTGNTVALHDHYSNIFSIQSIPSIHFIQGNDRVDVDDRECQ